LHRPEVRIGKRNVDGIELDRMLQFAPVGGNHVGCGGEPGGTAKLRHDLAAREALLSSAWIFCVGEYMLFPTAEPDRLIKRPRSVRVQRDARIGETLCKGDDGLISCVPESTPPLSL
jgi:hypothetical protein